MRKSAKYTQALLVFLLINLASANIFAQDEPQWLSQEKDSLNKMELQSKVVEGYTWSYNEAGFDLSSVTPSLSVDNKPSVHTCIASKDSNFLIYFKADVLYPLKDSLVEKVNDNQLLTTKKTGYWLWVEQDLMFSLGKSYDSLEKSIVHRMPMNYAKETYHADEVFTYPMNLKHGNFQGKYNHFQVVYIVKKDRGVVRLYCFYNDQGNWNQRTYRKGVETMFWFR